MICCDHFKDLLGTIDAKIIVRFRRYIAARPEQRRHLLDHRIDPASRRSDNDRDRLVFRVLPGHRLEWRIDDTLVKFVTPDHSLPGTTLENADNAVDAAIETNILIEGIVILEELPGNAITDHADVRPCLTLGRSKEATPLDLNRDDIRKVLPDPEQKRIDRLAPQKGHLWFVAGWTVTATDLLR
jgi:hypothetical protein